ncbi:muellerian-inhibiting factor [Hyperolius riggenbachi]|uniref:muellerian-inhibiting factor n=1 Tax=Hyperolius riggenbachi TaxID=752182 RepID=UPI0035A318AA
MGTFCAACCLLFPLLCQTLPTDVGERDTDESMMDKKGHNLPLEQESHSDTECGAKARSSWGNLDTNGYLRAYDTGFLDSVKQEPWEQQQLFGMCSETQPAALKAMKELANFLADPQGRQLVILHLQKVEWESGVSMQFHGSAQDHKSSFLQHLHLLLAVFYPETSKLPAGQTESRIMVSGEAFTQPQVACMSSETRYLVLKLSGTVKSVETGDLNLHLSFHMKQHPEGLALPRTESEQYLFGTDEKCLTKVTPVILMVVGHHTHSGSYSSILQSDNIKSGASSSKDNQMMPTVKKDEFLAKLSHFSALLMAPHGKAFSTVYLPLDPAIGNAGDLRPQLLNVSEMEALKWLVESQEPLVFLFLPGSKNLLARRVQGALNGTLLEKITEKMQMVLEDMKDILSTSEHIYVLQKLLNSCHGYVNVSYLHSESEIERQLVDEQHGKLNSLMLLKTLQTVRAYWQDRKKLSRQNRQAGLKAHCRLQELSINLKSYAEYKHIQYPEQININNCVGPCRFPQTTQSDYQAHVILLIKLQERKQTDLHRPPCCVPIKYDELWLMVADENGIRLQLYPNMIAKDCGCR